MVNRLIIKQNYGEIPFLKVVASFKIAENVLALKVERAEKWMR